MSPRSKVNDELAIEDLIQIKITVSRLDIELWHKYSKEVGYPTATTARDFFRAGLMAKIAESNKALVWKSLIKKADLGGDAASGDDS